MLGIVRRRYLLRHRQAHISHAFPGGSGYSWDDFAALFCYVLLVPTDVSADIEVQNGLGMDMYMLSMENIVRILEVCGLFSRPQHSVWADHHDYRCLTWGKSYTM